jgi:Uma2 family endonuclease
MVAQDVRSDIPTRWTTEIAELWPPQGQWMEVDYFALPETSRLIELSDGELIMTPPATNTHQRVLINLFLALEKFIAHLDAGVLNLAPMPVRLWPGKIREPDIFFLTKEHLDRVGEQFSGPPDLIVEVTSPSTRRADRRDKFNEYAQASVREYWLVDPDAQTIEVFVLEDGVYVLSGKYRAGEMANSVLLDGFAIAVEAVFKI